MQSKKSLVSVIIPFYRDDKWIKQTVKSVINQTYINFEIIIVDDFSNNKKSELILKEIEYKIDSVRILKLDYNHGISYTRNFGASKAKGEYLLFLDSDDLLHKDFLTRTVKKIKSSPNNVGIVATYVRTFYHKNDIWNNIKSGGIENYIYKNNNVISSLIKKNVWESVKGFDENMNGFEDWEFWIAACSKGWLVEVVEEILFFYRIKNKMGISNTNKIKEPNSMKYIVEKHKEIFKEYIVEAVYNRELLLRSYKNELESSWGYKLEKAIKKPSLLIRKLFGNLLKWS